MSGASAAAASSDLRRRRREAIGAAGVYLVTEEALSGGRPSEEVVAAALRGGVRVVQVREKDGTARRAFEIARAARVLTSEAGALLLVNDRVDLALAVGADGVHVGQDDLPVATVRALLGPDAVIGLSITDPSQLDAADVEDADYLGVGAVYPTGSKGDATNTGLALLAAARVASRVPIIAIGGITAENAESVLAAGADTLAVISAITGAPDPGAAAAALAEVVRATRERSAQTTAGGSR